MTLFIRHHETKRTYRYLRRMSIDVTYTSQRNADVEIRLIFFWTKKDIWDWNFDWRYYFKMVFHRNWKQIIFFLYLGPEEDSNAPPWENEFSQKFAEWKFVKVGPPKWLLLWILSAQMKLCGHWLWLYWGKTTIIFLLDLMTSSFYIGRAGIE